MINREFIAKNVKKNILLLVAMLLLLVISVGVTLAFLNDETEEIENTFIPSSVTTEVNETFNGTEKKDVSIKNTGDTEAYIRAAIVVTWQDTAGNVYAEKPEKGKAYTLDLNLDEGWKEGADGFYYWTKPVAGSKTEGETTTSSTGVLINNCKLNEGVTVPVEGYFLSVEVIGSGIQSIPTTVVTEMWKSGVSSVDADGTLRIKTEQGGE